MSRLSQIEPFVRSCVSAIAAFIGAQVTVVDDELNRIYGTKQYHAFTEDVEKRSSVFFERVLVEKQIKVVTDVQNDPVCFGCRNHTICTIKVEMGYPIDDEGQIIGVIGVSAFTDDEAAYIQQNYDRLIEFLKYIDLLITSQLRTVERSSRLQCGANHRRRTQPPHRARGGNGQGDGIVNTCPAALLHFSVRRFFPYAAAYRRLYYIPRLETEPQT